MKKLVSTTLGKVLLALSLFVVVLLLVLWKPGGNALAGYVLVALILTAVLWVALDLAFKLWQSKRQATFDARIAAKEGIEDRRREWAEWTRELQRQGIDRYQLPMYLLVGEPQSGKSIMLRNSDLHFPFGQNRLSGVGGTKGCDWWFTDQAVILDLAGRLFTHEGGASDEVEWGAFLELLAAYRPQCPANGVILVLPCDALASENESAVAKKAARMQAALLTLTNKLQVRLPVYIVLTKADKVFGFAECVHRLEAEKRQEMFGWSRPLEKLEAPFDVSEAQSGFAGMVERARLLRAQMLATARIPEALMEVDRFYAFPDELGALWPTLGVYLQRVFTESRLIDALFFRGIYLTSGLQSGAPIAKVCAELMGSIGEADRRNLEGLFTKQRAYFIKDLVRERIFTEQGLVRPTRQRVVRARRNAIAAYGILALSAAGSISWAAWRTYDLHRNKPQANLTVQALEAALEDGDPDVIADAAKGAMDSDKSGLAEVGKRVITEKVLPELSDAVVAGFAASTPIDNKDFLLHCDMAHSLLTKEPLEGESWLLFKRLMGASGQSRFEVLDELSAEDRRASLSLSGRKALLVRLDVLWKGVLDPESGWAKPGILGFWLAAWSPFDLNVLSGRDCYAAERFTNRLHLLFGSAPLNPEERSSIQSSDALEDVDSLAQMRERYAESVPEANGEWPELEELRKKIDKEGTLKVPLEVQELLKKQDLRDLASPSFLATVDGYSTDLLNQPKGGNAWTMAIFNARAACAGEKYVSRFQTLGALRQVLGADSQGFDMRVSKHLGGLLKALSTPELDLVDWRKRVEFLLDEYEKGLLRAWDETGNPETQLREHFEYVSPALETSGREAWLDGVVKLLVQRMKGNIQSAATYFLACSDLPEVKESRGVKALRDGVTKFKADPGDAAAMSERFAALQGESPPDNGAGNFVKTLFEALREVVLQQNVRPAFIGELEGLIGEGRAYRNTVAAIWGETTVDPDLEFFNRGGKFDSLMDKFGIERSGGPSEPSGDSKWSFTIFAGPREPRGREWEATEFLRELQALLLGASKDKTTAKGASIQVKINFDVKSSAMKNRDYVYVKSQAMKGSTASKKPTELAFDWGFGGLEGRPGPFSIRWTNALGHDNRQDDDLTWAEPGWFAPMTLAWRVEGVDDSWTVGIPLGNNYSCALTLRFDPPLPKRPNSMPFSSD